MAAKGEVEGVVVGLNPAAAKAEGDDMESVSDDRNEFFDLAEGELVDE